MARNKDEQAEIYLRRVTDRLKEAVEKMEMTQTDVINKCSKKGFKITKSTISKIWNGSGGCTLYNIANIAAALELDMNELCDTGNSQTISIPKATEEKLITKIPNYFDKYIGTYNLILYRTLSDEPGVMTGTMEFYERKSHSDLGVRIKIETNSNYAENKDTKVYEGTGKYSPQMHVLYISATNCEIGEEVYVIFPYIHLTTTELKSRIGLCLTSCAGTTRIPTSQRIMISREKISGDLMEIVKSQLLLNDSKIRIPIEQFEKIAKGSELPESFKEMFIDENNELMGAIKRKYYIISESMIRSSELSLLDRIKSICVLRKYSEAPKHTKVSDKANEFVYKIMEHSNNKEREQEPTYLG